MDLKNDYYILLYTDHEKNLWDDFVMNRSMNGTFLQTRNFLSYHPKERFDDVSLMIYDNKNRLVAVIPACEIDEDGKKTFFSHKGSTFGGIIYNRSHSNAEKMRVIIELLEEYLRKERFQKIYLKITPDIFCEQDSNLLQYILQLYNYLEYTELDTYIDLNNYKSDIVMNFNETKRKHIRRLEKRRLIFRKLKGDEEIRGFYNLLELNLAKYGVTPIHSVDEILDFKNTRLKDNVHFYGVYLGDQQLAAGMLFDFGNKGVIHAQNLSSDPNNREIDAIEYLYYGIIKEYKEKGYKYLSWGISTEQQGKYLNMGLIRNKESYGSNYYLNRTFFKEISSERY